MDIRYYVDVHRCMFVFALSYRKTWPAKHACKFHVNITYEGRDTCTLEPHACHSNQNNIQSHGRGAQASNRATECSIASGTSARLPSRLELGFKKPNNQCHCCQSVMRQWKVTNMWEPQSE